MFSRLEKIEAPLFEVAYIQRAYICTVNWLTNCGGMGGGIYSSRLTYWGVLMGF